MNHSDFIIEYELHIVDESEQQARELEMQVGFVFVNEARARQRENRLLECLSRLALASLIPERGDRMSLVLRLRRDAVRA